MHIGDQMGLDVNATKGLLYAKKRGVIFSEVIMIGRQIINDKTSQLRKNARKLGFTFSKEQVKSMLMGSSGFAESFFKLLDSNVIHSIDKSDYEGATFSHDMNVPIPQKFKSKYSLVLDSGSLEHIFNFPIAIKNCLEMVRPGGHFISITPANNWMGHGFYQFSPELFFSILKEENGFQINQIIIYEKKSNSNWYSVLSPEEVNSRVTLINKKPTYLFIIAKKIKEIDILQFNPQQSDYKPLWDNKKLTSKGKPLSFRENLINKIKTTLSSNQKKIIRKTITWIHRKLFKFNPKHYKKIKF